MAALTLSPAVARRQTLWEIARAAYQSLEDVPVPDEWRAGVDPEGAEDRFLQCDATAMRYLFAHAGIEGMTLVQGCYDALGFRSPHWWVELPGGIVFDGVAGRFFDRLAYVRTMRAEALRRFSVREARANLWPE